MHQRETCHSYTSSEGLRDHQMLGTAAGMRDSGHYTEYLGKWEGPVHRYPPPTMPIHVVIHHCHHHWPMIHQVLYVKRC